MCEQRGGRYEQGGHICVNKSANAHKRGDARDLPSAPQLTLASLVQLVVIDFVRSNEVHKSHPEGWIMVHVRAGQEVFKWEIEEAGFVYEQDLEVPGMAENYVMVFTKPTVLCGEAE